MADNRRLEDLKRRVQQDPASIAFAALADEYRRLGLFHDAIETCRAGLQRHPAYLSARVTLGRALLEIGEYDEAQAELDQVIRAAPDNLAAIRALAEIHRRRGDSPDGYALDPQEPAAAATSPAASPLPASVAPAASAPSGMSNATSPDRAAPAEPAASGVTPEALKVQPPPAPAAEPAPAPPVEPTPAPPAAIPLSTLAPGAPPLEVVSHMAASERAESPAPAPAPMTVPAVDPVCERLEQFLAAIDRARASEAGADVQSR